MRRVASNAVLGVAVLVAGCSYGHTMERAAPVSSICPERSLPRATEGPPDTLSIRWYRAQEPRDRALSARWCATVGAPVVRLDPTGAFPTWTQETGFDVVTWNMYIGGGDLYRFLHEELGLDCLAARPGLEAGRRPFVLLLQEAWRHSEALPEIESSDVVPWPIDPERDGDGPEGRGGHGPDIETAARRCGLALVYVPSARNGPDTGPRPDEDKGNAILSTAPLTAPIALDLPLEGGRKVAVAATVTAPRGERVRVVSVHLDVASTLVRTLLSGNQTRVRQASGLLDGLVAAERDGPLTTITVVGGDFNTWAGNEATLKLMRQAFPDSPRSDGLPTRGSYPTDHIFFRRGSFLTFSADGYARIEDRYGSDHHARRLTLRFAPLGTEARPR